jgi:hypothetical protein
MNLSAILVMNTQVSCGSCPRVNSTNASFMMGRVYPDCHLQDIRPNQFPLGQSCSDVWPGDHHSRPVDGHKTLLVPYPAFGAIALPCQHAVCN